MTFSGWRACLQQRCADHPNVDLAFASASRPQNYISDAGVDRRYAGNPTQQRLLEAKTKLLRERATPSMYMGASDAQCTITACVFVCALIYNRF